MKTIHAIHEIHIKGKVIEAGTTGDIPDEKYDELKKLGAIRDLNDDEKALRGLSTKKVSVEDSKPDGDRKALEARAEAAEVKFNKNISDEKLLERVVEAENVKKDADVEL